MSGVLPQSRFTRLVRLLLEASSTDQILLELDHRQALIRRPMKGTATYVLVLDPEQRAEDEERVHHLIQSLKLKLEVIVLGSDVDGMQLLKDASPLMTRKTVFHFHHLDDGTLHTGSKKGPSFGLLQSANLDAEVPEDVWTTFEAQLRTILKQGAERMAELRAFGESYKMKKAPATPVILVLIGIFYVLELAFGGTESVPTLMRLGALSVDRVQAGDYWRLFTVAFLHGGFTHVLFSCWILYALGMSLERILGTQRFLLLYGASALGGSLFSLYSLGERFSVGASGALWGLLVAEGILGLNRDGLLPEQVAASLKKTARVNLLLNVAVSFWPNVDAWAHLGGGLAGALLLFPGFLTTGLPRWKDQLQGGRSASQGSREQTPAWISLASRALVLVCLACLAIGLKQGEVWRLRQPPELERVALPALGYALELPDPMLWPPLAAEDDPSGPKRAAFGAFRMGPGVLEVMVFDEPNLNPKQVSGQAQRVEKTSENTLAETPQPLSLTAMTDPESIQGQQEFEKGLLAMLEAQLTEVRPKMTLVGKVRHVALGGYPGLIALIRYDESKVELQRGFVLRKGALIRADLTVWPVAAPASKGVVQEILASIAPLETGENMGK